MPCAENPLHWVLRCWNTTGIFGHVPVALRPAAFVLALLRDKQTEYILLACRRPEPSKARIAEQMHIAPDTVKRHCEDVYRLLDVHTKVELYIEAVRIGLVKCPCQLAREAQEQAKRKGLEG